MHTIVVEGSRWSKSTTQGTMQCILKMVWGPYDLNQGVGTTDAVFVENPSFKRLKGKKMKGREKFKKIEH